MTENGEERISRRENRVSFKGFVNRNWDERSDAVNFLAKCFCAGVPIRQALDATSSSYGTKAWDSVEAQEALIHSTFAYEKELQCKIDGFTFGRARCARFTRLLLDEIDHCNVDVDETLATQAAELCAAHGSRDVCRWVTLHVPGAGSREKEYVNDIVILRIADALSSIGLQVWESGVWLVAVLANSYPTVHESNHDQIDGEVSCHDLRESIRGKRVLEIGAGTGLSAAAIKNQGASHAWLTDVDAVVKNLDLNIRMNAADDVVTAAALDVSDASNARYVADAWEIDTVLVADVTYDDGLSRDVISAIAAIVSGTPRVAWLIATKRNPTSLSKLSRLFQRAHLAASLVSTHGSPVFPEYLVHYNHKAISAWRLHDSSHGCC